MLTTGCSPISRTKQKDGREIWPDNDFVNSCQEFGRQYQEGVLVVEVVLRVKS